MTKTKNKIKHQEYKAQKTYHYLGSRHPDLDLSEHTNNAFHMVVPFYVLFLPFSFSSNNLP